MTTTSTPSPEALPAMQEGEYPPMPEAYDGAPHHEGLGIVDVYDADQMRAYVDADRADRPVFTDEALFQIIRGTGYVTRGQAWDIVELLQAAPSAAQPGESEGGDE